MDNRWLMMLLIAYDEQAGQPTVVKYLEHYCIGVKQINSTQQHGLGTWLLAFLGNME